jgi:hypothetical protein
MHSPLDMKRGVDVIESSLGGLAAHRDSIQNLYVSCRRMLADVRW